MTSSTGAQNPFLSQSTIPDGALASAAPLVSCIMPTFNRRAFVPSAIACFQAQDYPNLELVIVDDGTDAVADCLPIDPCIRYHRLDQRRTIGAKRNLACELAVGELIVHWDDDDWYPPWRVSTQVAALQERGADICGTSQLFYQEPSTGRAWRYACVGQRRAWAAGNTLVYRRAFWIRNRFPDCSVGEDTRFVWRSSAARICDLANPELCVATIHPSNTAAKKRDGPYWQTVPIATVVALLDGTGRHVPGSPPPAEETAPKSNTEPKPRADAPNPERGLTMLTIAREADLALPEVVAYNDGQTLPRMRQWELPYALTQLRLDDTSAILDCTINPCGFGARLQRLYPHTLYRHWSPIQSGAFAPPFGFPDAAFDRVVCINTLEHLLASQQDELMAAMAGKLKPGGLLVLTSDAYFPSSWSNPTFLAAGVMRADRGELFNGWNMVTAEDWIALGAKHGLQPLTRGVPAAELAPREDDPTLYRNPPPFSHACIGGVFVKGEVPSLPRPKTVLLALLSWNTRDVTLDSVHAYLHEARLLQRMGQRPVLCLCDNGSADGTAEALRELEPVIDVPYRLIVNTRNRGNSIARNQIISVMREVEADYVLFMDGDIEVVPFSSFAMLRYMETCGRQLGCIGADSAGQSRQRTNVSPAWYAVDPTRSETTNLVAWTQYGLFRREVFDDGVQFDEHPPFDQPGWGFEDNDLAFQMEMQGYRNQRFFGMTYLHRDPRSSVRNMRLVGIDPQRLYESRQRYVVDKWASVPPINEGPLSLVRRVRMRL